jgi:hypothetical protein
MFGGWKLTLWGKVRFHAHGLHTKSGKTFA